MEQQKIDLDALERSLYYDERGLTDMDYDDAKALIAELRELRARTTPEVIAEKHRDGREWMCWIPCLAMWLPCIFDSDAWHLDDIRLSETPTHALPMPEDVKP